MSGTERDRSSRHGHRNAVTRAAIAVPESTSARTASGYEHSLRARVYLAYSPGFGMAP